MSFGCCLVIHQERDMSSDGAEIRGHFLNLLSHVLPDQILFFRMVISLGRDS